MKRLACILLVLCPAVMPAQEEDVFPPRAIPADRYEAMMKRSPFVLPTKEEAPAAAPAWTSDFRIVSVIRLGEESIVLARQVSTDERIPIRARENQQGLRLVELNLAADPHDVSAVIAKGADQGTIVYDESILSDVPRSVAPGNPALKAE